MSTTTDRDAVAALADAYERVTNHRSAFEALDGDADAVADAYEAFERVLDRWEERATDWDDFEGYVEFRDDLSETLSSIPEDVPESDAFVEADGHVKTTGVSKSLKERDFDAAREALEPARRYAETRQELRDAEDDYRTAYRAAQDRRDELQDRIADLERLAELADADLDAPVEELRDPIDSYNESASTAFRTFRRNAPVRDLLDVVATASEYPLVPWERPPETLLTYVRERPAGEYTLEELLEYADYSRSKLDHYVDDADLLKRRVATNRTYLERLSSDPLRIEWPPAEAAVLRRRVDELVSLVSRFADEETVAALRSVQSLTRRDDFDRLRTAAVARAELSEAERRRVERGDVASDLEAAREAYERVERALEEYDLD